MLLLYFHSKKVFFHSTSSSETLHIQHALNLSNSKIDQISNIPRPATRHIVDHEKTLLSFPLRIVFLSRIVPKKNLDYAIRLLKTVKSKVVFDVYGPIQDHKYWAQCLSSASTLPSNVQFNYCGSVTSQQVPAVLCQYALILFPTLGENYGHVITEALNSGCPVLISNKTPWQQADLGQAGWALDLDNPEEFSSLIGHMCENRPLLIEASSAAIDVFLSHYNSDYSLYLDLFSST